jgi:hypothetical protein
MQIKVSGSTPKFEKSRSKYDGRSNFARISCHKQEFPLVYTKRKFGGIIRSGYIPAQVVKIKNLFCQK